VTDATTFRLDTADIAIEAGWQLESMRRIDEFSKDGVTVMVQYAADDEIECLTRSQKGRADEVHGADSFGKADRLRIWLGIRPVSNRNHEPAVENAKCVPITVERLRAEGMILAAYVKNVAGLQMLDLVDNNAYATARDYIRAYDGRKKVMWSRDGTASEPGDKSEVWWAEMPLPDGRVVGWFQVNHNFRGP
jgi:hypothetical protein